MWESILNFMQQNDPYKNWLNIIETDEKKEYILSTLLKWLQEDLFITSQIELYLTYLETETRL